jgi:hypothetical protein
MHIAQEQGLQDAEQFARNLFKQKPHIGIDDAARIINDNCKRGLIKPIISSIRREVRQALEAEAMFSPEIRAKMSKGYVIRPKSPFNPPKVVINPEPIRDIPAALAQMASKPDMEVHVAQEAPVKPKPASAEVKATKIDRLRYLEDWCLEHPQGTIEGAREALRVHFQGVAMGTKIIADTLRQARQLWESQRPTLKAVETPVAAPVVVAAPGGNTVQHQVAAVAATMRALGIRLVEITDSGKVRIEFGA